VVLDLAILGLLKEQPLHGYELKKRLSETLGLLWGVSFGSLYPALRRLERAGSIETAGPLGAPVTRTSMPATGSISGEAAAARLHQVPKPNRRARKAYRITERGDRRFAELLAADDTAAGDGDRAFALRLAFCRHLPSAARLELLEQRRADLTERLGRSRRARPGRADRYTLSLVEHHTQSLQRDLEWVTELIAAERRLLPHDTPKGATA
jgi:DNA-binding PadR family transcriptional regulator